MKIPNVKVVIQVEGQDSLVVESAEDGWHITGDRLRGSNDLRTIIDPEGHRAMAEIIRHFGAQESMMALVRGLNQHAAEEVEETINEQAAQDENFG